MRKEPDTYTGNQLGFAVSRYSLDKEINAYGRRLIDMCKSTNIHIANGRIGLDKGIGQLTCKNASLVDYVIMSPQIFPYVKTFHVEAFNELYSDVHNAITFSIRSMSNLQIRNENNYKNTSPAASQLPPRPKWDKDKCYTFKNRLDILVLDEVNLEIDKTIHGNNSNYKLITQKKINDLVDSVCLILTEAAEDNPSTNKPKKPLPEIRKNTKPWFNKTCKIKRSEYYKAKRLFRAHRDAPHQHSMIKASKDYKRTLKNEYKLYYIDLNNKLQSLKSNNPKEYWNLLNKESGTTNNVNYTNIDISAFASHFKQLNMAHSDNESSFSFDVDSISENNSIINKEFTKAEVIREIKKLKNNKACGMDRILNEYFKTACQSLAPTLTKLFNLVLETGIVPDSWTVGTIQPLYKNKGDTSDPENYRGITILSCFSKLFTGLVNTRITQYFEENGIIGEEQAGFRSNYSTVDHMFTLKSIIDIYLHNGRRLYCAFVDYKKAFDTVCRSALWKKVLSSGIDGKIFKVIHNLYNKAKSCVKNNGELSDFFKCSVGVRQGENLSPILFAIYLNDLEKTLGSKCQGLTAINKLARSNLSKKEIEMFMKLHIMLYADDTILLAETAEGLQQALDSMNEYCKQWKLSVNTDKTKVVIFSRGKVRNLPVFTYDGKDIEVKDNYSYLGITFNYNGKFKVAVDGLVEQANKAMFSLLCKGRKLNLQIHIMLDLFDSIVAPILLYGSEIWGHEDTLVHTVEKVHLKFCKYLLKLNKSTPSYMIYGELGRMPLQTKIQNRVIGFWARILTGKNEKIVFKLYSLQLALFNKQNEFQSNWLTDVKHTLDTCGMSNIWNEQSKDMNTNWVKCALKLKLDDIYKQNWLNTMENAASSSNYRLFKQNFGFEPYLTVLPKTLSVWLCKFRTRNNKMPIIKSKYNRLSNIENTKSCQLQACDGNEIGDEYHYIFKCKSFHETRKKYIKNSLANNPNILKMNTLFNSRGTQLIALAKFCKFIICALP